MEGVLADVEDERKLDSAISAVISHTHVMGICRI